MSTIQEDIMRALDDQGRAWADFKSSNGARMKVLESELGDLLKKSGRPSTGASQIPDVESKAFAQYLRGQLTAQESKALWSQSDPAGGFLVPLGFSAQIDSMMMQASQLIKAVRQNTVGTSQTRHIVSAGDATGGWSAELGTRTATNPSALNAVQITLADLYANPAASNSLIDDSFFNVADWLAAEISTVFSNKLETAIVSGDGILGPRGFTTGPTPVTTADATRAFGTLEYVPTGHATAFAATAPGDALIGAIYKLQPQYRRNATWVMNQTTLAAVRQMKDGSGSYYLWQSSQTAGQPSTLFGLPVIESAAMPDLGANKFPIALGDFSQAYAVDSHQAGLRVIVDNISTKGSTSFYTWKRCGGSVLNTNAIKLIKCATT